jgi:ABC-type glycerol-3-phosphate transport system permease component
MITRATGHVLAYAILAIGALVFAAPFVWMVTASFQPESFATAVPIQWIPRHFTVEAYTTSWGLLPFPSFYRNTFLVTSVNIIGLTLSSSLVAFAFARMRFWGRDVLFMLLLATMMLPGQVTLIPIYLFWNSLGAVNTFWPLIVPEWLTNAYNVFLLRQYMMTISPEMDDAARIDGASWFRIYWQVIMPMSRPALGVIAIQAFAWNWNNFLGPLIYLNDVEKMTLAIGLQMFKGREGRTLMTETMAMSTVALIPVLIVFFIAQRYFIQGIVITGVKG